ncbi:OmpL47-type beta-barrel domain-containing protein [Aquipuribacter sp. SD81]|uniref:OmpL47-type beta-barrel domain-containing protein n=1 Tax=Aquipuribacter sp. SD81 TaxID=3127703 RepID=UPI003019627F
MRHALSRGRWRPLAAALSLAVVGSALTVMPAASAATITGATFSGSAGTVVYDGTLYARTGSPLTLTVATGDGARCVEVSNPHAGTQTTNNARTSWTFTMSALAGEGAKNVTVAARDTFNNNGQCTSQQVSTQAAYTVDNTGPVVTGVVSPAPNAAGWVKENATVTWSAVDLGSGAPSGPTPSTTTVSENTGTSGRVVTATATDRLGNAGSGSVTVRVDKATPTISAAQTENADGTTTITFTCADAHSGITSCLASGSTTNARTVPGGTTVTGTATDAAGNTTTLASTAPVRDTTGPVLTGTPRAAPNEAGWYRGDVVVGWTASDPESGVVATPADTTITGEGRGLTSSATATNGVGLRTTAESSPAVDIDRTAPTTTVTGASDGWTNGSVTLGLSASDALSGVATTTYSVDGGETRTGTSVVLDTEGQHTVRYASTDKAGNTEAERSVTVRIDRTAPSIARSFTPGDYADGSWTNGDVSVTFTCSDEGGSGLTSCSAPVTLTAEGEHPVTGTAVDGAGNTGTATASVRIDRTAPVVSASLDREPNEADWFRQPVTVSFSAEDALSGVVRRDEPVELGEGEGQSATGTATDAAGNTGSATVGGIDVDLTAPTLVGTAPERWSRGDVTVTWACADALSGPTGDPADTTVTGEGDDLTATASCTDVAGNGTSTTVSGIQIDRTAPVTTASAAGSPVNGWYAAPVEVTLAASDNLSGVDKTTYRVDGGEPQPYEGSFTVSGDGSHHVTFSSTDVAGNEEEVGTPLAFRIDTTDPVTTVLQPQSPTGGWFTTSGIPVAFSVAENGSGVAATYYRIDDGEVRTYGKPFTESLADGVHTIQYWTVDIAGNEEGRKSVKGTVTVSVDTTAPSVTPGDVEDTTWRNTPRSASFSASDAGSGLADDADRAFTLTASSESTRDANGTVVPTQVERAVRDVAGNTTTRRLSALIDTTRPVISGTDVDDTTWRNTARSQAFTADDALSGLADPADAAFELTATEESTKDANGNVVPTRVRRTVTDKAGNSSTRSVSVLIDTTRPVISGTDVDDTTWRNTARSQAFTADDALSGLADERDAAFELTATAESTKDNNGTVVPTQVRRTVTDKAGNTSSRVLSARIDRTNPVISGSDVTIAAWQNTPLTRAFTASDALSGLKDDRDAAFELTASAESTKGANGTVVPTRVQRTVADEAGNTSTRSVSALIDLTGPTGVSFVGGPAAGARYLTSTVPAAPTCEAVDALSSVSSCVVTGWSTVAGEHTLTATAKDAAGNVTTATRTYTVRNWTTAGFFAPVDMGSGVWNTIKGGNTVPLKFRVFDDGQQLTSTSAVKGFSALKVSCTGGTEDAIEVFSTTGATELRYDTTGQQFVQNWKTPTGSGCYKVTLSLADGSTTVVASFMTKK